LTIGTVLNIQKYSIYDGPGIRTSVFLKGCVLACWWCHNPESLALKPAIVFWKNRCIGCGDCVKSCSKEAIMFIDQALRKDEEKCSLCGACIDACPTGAMEKIGKSMTKADVMKEIEKDRVFYEESGGGVTFSGGEALTQIDFLDSLLEACNSQGIHTALDTSGYAPWQSIARIKDKVDLFLYDIKLMDEGKHSKYTGVSNQLIVENLKKLAANNRKIWIRVPVTEGQFALPDSKEELAKANTWLKAAQIDTIVSFGTLLLITVVFTALGAAVLHAGQLVPSGMQLLEHQSAFLTIVHPGLVYLYWLAVWCALWGVLSSIFELYPSTCYEAFRTASSWVREKGKAGIAKYVWVYMCLGGLAYNWAGFNVVTIVMVGSILGGALSCGLWCLAQIYAERKVLPPQYRMAPWVVVCVALSGVFLIAMAVFSVLDQFKLI